MKFVGEINDRQSADDRRELAPKEVWQVIRALQKGPRVVVEITPMTLRKDQASGMGDMCETVGENTLRWTFQAANTSAVSAGK